MAEQHRDLILSLSQGSNPVMLARRNFRKPYSLQMNSRHKHYGYLV
jgi:hypothetical protein